MVRTFCTSGEREGVKGAVHAAGGTLAAVMAVYNIAAWCYRRERHLGINAIVYTAAILWEIKQTSRHLERLDFWRTCPQPDAVAPLPEETPRAA
jgi:hypothetical protein